MISDIRIMARRAPIEVEIIVAFGVFIEYLAPVNNAFPNQSIASFIKIILEINGTSFDVI